MKLRKSKRNRLIGLPNQSFETTPITSSSIALHLGGSVEGPDRQVFGPGYLGVNQEKCSLTFLSDPSYLSQVGISCVVITTKDIQISLSEDITVIVVPNNPKGHWAKAFELFLPQRNSFPSFQASSAKVHPSALIGDGVFIDEYSIIEEGAVVRGPTYIGKGSRIGPLSVVGGEGLEIAFIDDRRLIVPHLGGVWIEDNVEIQALCTVDKDLLLDFTRIGSGTKLDNHVHVAHGVRIGRDCTLTASSEISGSVVLGDNVWLAPQTSVINGISIRDGAFVGLGASVRRNVEQNEVIVGSHQSLGIRCSCGVVVKTQNGLSRCDCGRLY